MGYRGVQVMKAVNFHNVVFPHGAGFLSQILTFLFMSIFSSKMNHLDLTAVIIKSGRIKSRCNINIVVLVEFWSPDMLLASLFFSGYFVPWAFFLVALFVGFEGGFAGTPLHLLENCAHLSSLGSVPIIRPWDRHLPLERRQLWRQANPVFGVQRPLFW